MNSDIKVVAVFYAGIILLCISNYLSTNNSTYIYIGVTVFIVGLIYYFIMRKS